MFPPLSVVVGTRTCHTGHVCCLTRQRGLLSWVETADDRRRVTATEAAGRRWPPRLSARRLRQQAMSVTPKRRGHAGTDCGFFIRRPPFGRRFDAECVKAE